MPSRRYSRRGIFGQSSTKVGIVVCFVVILLIFYLWTGGTSAKHQVTEALKRKTATDTMISYSNGLATNGNVPNGQQVGRTNAGVHYAQNIPEFNDNKNVYKTANLNGAVPDNVLKLKDLVKVSENRVDCMGVNVFYREALPPHGNYTKGDILLLHGQAFTSNNWIEIGSSRTFAAAGYRTVAVDLPGYGQTGGSSLHPDQKSLFIKKLIENLNLKKPVLVSPSMSGSFSLPFVMSHSEDLSAYVPIAPVGTGEYKPEDYQKIRLPTLIVYGSRDTSLGVNSRSNLQNLPNGRVLRIENAGHAAYLNQPDVWHSALINFLDLMKTYGSL